MIIAIDGPAASGKGTIGARLAAHLGYHHLDTGLLYRGVAFALLRSARPLSDAAEAVKRAEGLPLDNLDGGHLGAPEIGQAASKVAAIPEVRAALVARQRSFARQQPGAVLVGRDIGSVICPEAEVKVFLTANLEKRAARRADQLGVTDSQERLRILEGIRERDHRDMTRSVAPLVKADDARLLDTSELDIEAAFRAVLALVEGERKPD